MGAKQTKEEVAGRKLMKQREEAIARQRYYELYEMRQDWEFVFGSDVPKQKKDVLQIHDMTPRDVWMEELYLFKQIVATRPDELFHPPSEYALKWSPPGSSMTLLVPFDNPAMQEAVIIKLSMYPPPVRKLVLFHFGPRDPNQTMFREAVHPASLVSYHHRNEVLKKLCDQFLENRMDIEEFKNTIGSTYDVWKRAMYNMLPEDEQVFHTYLTAMPEEDEVPTQNVIDNEYLEGRITLQEYEDLKFPERKKKKDMEKKVYPEPHITSECIICHNPDTGCVQCNVCDNRLCIDCVKEKFHAEETKEGSYLLIHRRFCLRLASLKPVHLAVNLPPAYLRELRMTGQGAAMKLLEEESKELLDDDDISLEDEEDEDEKRHRLEMERIKIEREYNTMMKENPPDLQKCIYLWEHKIQKKFNNIRKSALEQQIRIDEPGHSDMFVEREERLKKEIIDKIPDTILKPVKPLLVKAIELDLQESKTCKEFIDKLTLVCQECEWLQIMTSEQHWDDLHNGITVEEREVIVAEEKRIRLEERVKEEEEEKLLKAQKMKEEEEEKRSAEIEEALASGISMEEIAEAKAAAAEEEAVLAKKQADEEAAIEAQKIAEDNINITTVAKKKKKKKKHSSDADDKEHHHHAAGGGDKEEEHWHKPTKEERFARKKSIHKHDDSLLHVNASAAPQLPFMAEENDVDDEAEAVVEAEAKAALDAKMVDSSKFKIERLAELIDEKKV